MQSSASAWQKQSWACQRGDTGWRARTKAGQQDGGVDVAGADGLADEADAQRREEPHDRLLVLAVQLCAARQPACLDLVIQDTLPFRENNTSFVPRHSPSLSAFKDAGVLEHRMAETFKPFLPACNLPQKCAYG